MSEGRRLAGDTIVFGLSYAVSRSVSFALLPIYTRFLGAAEYGALDVILSLNRALMVPASLGMDSGLGLALQESPPAEQPRRATSALVAQLAWLASVAVVLLAVAGPLARGVFGADDRVAAIRLGVLLLASQVALNFATGIAKWKREPWRFFALAVGSALASGTGSALAVIALRAGAGGAVTGLLLGTALFVPVGFALVTRHFAAQARVADMKRSFVLGLPFAAAGASELIFPVALRLILLGYGGLEAVGIFAAANTVCLVITVANYAFSGAWYPFALSEQGRRLRAEWPRVVRLYGLGLIGVAVLLALLAPPLVTIVLGGGVYGRAMPLFAPIALGYWAKAVRQESAVPLVADGLSWAYSAFGWLAVLAALALARLLVGRWGLEGAAWGLFGGEAIAFAAQTILAARRKAVVFAPVSALAMAVCFVLLAMATALPPHAIGAEIALRILYAALFAAAILVLRAVPLADIRHAGLLLRSLLPRHQ